MTAGTLLNLHLHVTVLSPRAAAEYLNVILKQSTTLDESRSPMLSAMESNHTELSIMSRIQMSHSVFTPIAF